MTKYIFFSGKGGVGKTTMAAATAVYYAGKGRQTLLVSTDPAGNLGDIFECGIGPEAVQLAPNLEAAQMDAHAITEAYKQRMLAPLAEVLDETMMESVKEQFNSGCTVEIATFDKFTDYLENEAYELIIFDTAPTGHTLRLMTLPKEWSGFIEKSAAGSGQTCIGPVSQIEDSRHKYEHAVEVMQNPSRSEVYLVSRPEKTSVYETIRARTELERTGIHHFSLIINGIFPDHGADLGIFSRMRDRQQEHIALLKGYGFSSIMEAPLLQREVKGMAVIAAFGRLLFDGEKMDERSAYYEEKTFEGFARPEVLKSLLAKKNGQRIVVLTGKGGVGKTVAACALGLHLSKQGNTLLVTTDPAAHIGHVLEKEVAHEQSAVAPGLWAANIDQKKAVETYKQTILDDARNNGYSPDLIASLEEELESPCTEEIAVFEKFAGLLTEGQWDFIVLDTAPTGHTLRLLELPFEYKKQIEMKRNVAAAHGNAPGEELSKIHALIQRLKDPATTAFLLVALPEFTPLHESHRASLDLERVGIRIQGVLINQVLRREDCPPGFAFERWKMQQYYLGVASRLFHLPLFRIFLNPNEIIGLEPVRRFAGEIFEMQGS